MWNTSDGDPTTSFTSNDVSLENFLSPFSYGQETPLPAFQTGSAIHAQNSKGFISQDCQWGCCYCRNLIKCFPVDSYGTSGQYVSKCHVPVTISTSSYSFQSSSITCATELATHNHKTVLGIRKILLGLKVRETDSLVGALVIFDPIRCLPMKWISLPSPVSSVTVLSHYEESGFARPFFNEAMLTMVGVAAVGMEGGQVFIVDLGLDDPNLSNWDSDLIPGIHRYQVTPVDPHELLIATKRHNLVTRNKLICVDLTSEDEEESESENNYYHYYSPDKSVLCTLEKDSISVTCLDYIPAIGSLIVGYSFGCFQIWGVDSAALLYSSPVPSAEVTNEVFGFAFQQPVDDPKNICYLWVLFGKQTLEMHYSHAELFGLLYGNKPYNENFGYIYEEFMQCSRKLSIRMEDYFDTASENEDSMDDRRCPLQRYSVRPIRMWSHSDHLTFFSWESNRNGVYYVGIFDLNQWYSNHASEKIRYSTIGLCPYWVAIPVETIDRFATVWDVGVVPKTIESWENPHSKLELHLYPASITFRGVCLSSNGTSTFEFFGIQEKMLRVLQRRGPDLMVDPGEYRNLCQLYGLEPVMSHSYDDLASQLDADRYFILSVLLESRRSSFIIEMANKWIDGSYVNVGCSVDLILGWVSSFTCAIRSVADQHWENLLTFRNEVLPPETAHFINYSNFIWHALLGVLNMLMRPNEVYESQTDDLENLKFLLEKFVQYSASLLMFYKAGILPEVDDHQFVPMMLKYYEQRRMDVKGALQNCDLLDPEIKSSHTLLIDYLLESFDEQLLREQWNLEPEESLYPPKHIGYILNMFMWAHEYPKAISRIIAYYLIDLSSIINETVKLRGDFASIIQLSIEEQTEIYNLWALDHGSCHEVLLFLSQKDRLHESDGLPWCAAVVLLTALGHGESIVELLQKSCPSKLGRLYFNLMTSSQTKYNFLIDDICSTPALMESSHLQNFFEVSDKHNLLGEFVKAKSCSAPTVITDALVEYLQSHSNFENCDRLLSYYIHKEDWEKLREHYDSVKTQSYVWKLTKHQRSVWQVRQKLVESLLKPTRQDFQKFASDGSPEIVYVGGPSKKIKIHHVKLPYTIPSSLNQFRANSNVSHELKLPPQLRSLKLHTAKSTCALSPMRSQSGFLHAVIGGSGGSDRNCTPKSVRDVTITPVRILSSSPDTPNSSSFGRRKSFRSTSRISFGGRSPINLVALLKTPAVDHRLSMSRSSRRQSGTADVTIDNDESVYGTPTNDQMSTGVQSIMKAKDKGKGNDSLRRLVCRKGLRFSEFTFRSPGGNDVDFNESENDKHIPMDIQCLDDLPRDNELEDVPGENEIEDVPGENELEDVPGENELEDVPGENELEDVSGENELEDVPGENELEDLPKDNKVENVPIQNESPNIKEECNGSINSACFPVGEGTFINYDRNSETSDLVEEESNKTNVPSEQKSEQEQKNVVNALDISNRTDGSLGRKSSDEKRWNLDEAFNENVNSADVSVDEFVDKDKNSESLYMSFEEDLNEANISLEHQKSSDDHGKTEVFDFNESENDKHTPTGIQSLEDLPRDNELKDVPGENKVEDLPRDNELENVPMQNESPNIEEECNGNINSASLPVGESTFNNYDRNSETTGPVEEESNKTIVPSEQKSLTEQEQTNVVNALDISNRADESLGRTDESPDEKWNLDEAFINENVSADVTVDEFPDKEKNSESLYESFEEDLNEADASSLGRQMPDEHGKTEVLDGFEVSKTPDKSLERRVTGELSEKRMTRSQSRRESEFDVSGSEASASFLDASADDSPKSSRKVRTTRNTRSRSKTPLPILPPVQEETELKTPSPVETVTVKEKTTKRKERKPKEPKTPAKEPKTPAKEPKTPAKEPKTPAKELKTPAKEKSSPESTSQKGGKRKVDPPAEAEVVKEKRKTSKRKSKQMNEEKTPEKEDPSADDDSQTKSATKRKRRQLQTYDYTPDLSTIIEDSDQSVSVLQATQVHLSPPLLSPPKSRGKRVSKTTPSKSIVGGKKTTRRYDLESDDDAKSDISAASSRSVRSTSTPELSILVESDQSFSMLSETVIEPRLPSPRRTRGRSKEPTVSPTKSIGELVVVKPSKRRKKDAGSDDDAQSDISVASSRSTRSTASRRSTERSLPKRTTRSSKK